MMARRSLARIGGIAVLFLAMGAAAVMVPASDWRELYRGAAVQLEQLPSLIATSYQRTPAIIFGLAASVLLPLIAIIAALIRAYRRRGRRQGELAQHAAAVAGQKTVNPGFTFRPAWLIVDGANRPPVPIDRELVSIGREEDNDLRFADPSVHRYHALVQRTAESGFEITDVSGPSGHGIRVNGARIVRARLSTGDLIEIGQIRMTFSRSRKAGAGALT